MRAQERPGKNRKREDGGRGNHDSSDMMSDSVEDEEGVDDGIL